MFIAHILINAYIHIYYIYVFCLILHIWFRLLHVRLYRVTSPSFKHCGFIIKPSSDRTPQRRQLLSADGKTLLNLWFLPHFSQVLHVFKTLDVSVRRLNLSLTQQ